MSLEPVTLRVYLSGRMTVDAGGTRFEADAFPGPQGRATFAFLVGHRSTPVTRDALAEALWPSGPPPSWDASLSSIVSKLRTLLAGAGLCAGASIEAGGGCYELLLPTGTWIDHEVASDAIHEAETSLKRGDPAAAYGPSAVAHHIARRPFLPGEEGRWFERRREKLAAILVRALECRARVYLWNEEYPLAVEAARDAVTFRPFRESGYRLLMRAHAAAGNAAEALRVYEACRTLMSRELGVTPSPQTKAVHSELLRSL